MQLVKHTIYGKKGSTVSYSIPNIRFDNDESKIKWDSFRFYTPKGDKVDTDGFKYFDVPEDEVAIIRDDDLNKMLIIIATVDQGIEAIESFEGEESETITIGLEGDIIISAVIPTSLENEIIVDYKEVTNG